MIDKKISSDRIRDFMRENRLSQKQMADRMGITANTLRSYLVQKFPHVSDNRFIAIGHVMKSKNFSRIVVDIGDDGVEEDNE